VSRLDGACNILERFRIADSPAQEQDKSRISPWHRSCWPFLLLVATLLLAPFSTFGQLYTGSVTGLVTDSSGATIPDVKITLVDQGKGYSFTATTDNTGRYLLRSIPPGTYTVTAETANFEKATQGNIKVDVSQNISVDLSLKIGSTTDTVEVKASTVQLQTEDAVTGQVVNRKFVNDLPLVDRNFTNLAYLAPGVTETNAPGTKNAQGGINFNSNGSRNATADVLIDGASASNFDQNSGLNNVLYTPSVDSVEEFKVQQANFTAEYGFSAGALINVVTRSGTNKFHGSVYEFFRNSVMDANNWFNNKNGQHIAALKRNDFGGSVGGPIRKDKTFFFFDYEGLRERDATNAFAGVPTAAERTGDFGVLCGANGGTFDATGLCSAPTGQLWDPYSGTFNSTPEPANPDVGPGALRQTFIPFNNLATYQSAGNPNLVGSPFQLPARPGNLIDPVAAKLIQLFPLPTNQATDLSSLQNNNWFGSGVNPSSNNQFDIKIDQRFSERDLLSAKYSQQNASSNSFDCFNNIADPCTGGPVVARRHIFSLTHTHTFSNTLILTATYGFQRGFDNQEGVSGNASGAQQGLAQLGFPSYLDHGFGTLPAITINGYSSANQSGNNTNIGTNPFSILREGQVVHYLDGTLSWVHKKHELKFGGEWRLHQINFTQPGWPSGAFSFDVTGTSQVSSDLNSGGDGLASFLMGIGPPGNGGGGCTPCQVGFVNFVSTESFQYAAFVQDNYRVTPKLTLNLGLRYELNTPRTERYNRMNSLDPTAASPLQLMADQISQAQSLGLPSQALQTLSDLRGIEVFASPANRSNYDTDYNDIQPRFGFAYQTRGGFVIRGGYGIYFSSPRSSASGTGPWGFEGFDVQPPWLTTLNLDHATPWNTLSNTACQFNSPFTCGVAPPPGNSLGAFNDLGFSAVGPIKRVSLNTPYEQAWSFGFQKKLPGKILLDASYVGKKGTHLYLGGFRENNILPASAIAGLTPDQIGNLNNPVANPFFDPNPGPCDRTHFICDSNSALGQPTVSAFQLLLPFPQYTGFQGDSPPIANSIYHALQIRAEREFSNGLQFLVTYTWSKSIDDASASDDSFVFLGGGTTDGSTLSVQNPYNLRAERAVSVFDIPHIFQASFVYELPIGRGRKFGDQLHPVLDAVAGGWQINGIVRINSGRPLIPLLLNTNAIPTFGQRPILTGTLQRASGSPGNFTDPGTSYFSNASFDTTSSDNVGVLQDTATVAPFTFGNAPRTITSVRQPGTANMDVSLFKQFALSKRNDGIRLQFRAEAFNVFNHPQFQGPDMLVGDSNFGVINSTVNNPRELQLALKLYF
jgi:Carboxypeptidase regulatory-like domain/TonB dependent receptor